MTMTWASALGTGDTLAECLAAAAAQIRQSLGTLEPHLLVAFVSSVWQDDYEQVPDELLALLPCKTFIGCSGGGVIGAGREAEFEPAVSLTAAHLPGVTLRPFHVVEPDLPDMDAAPLQWEELMGVKPSDDPHFMLLADPFSFNVKNLVMGLDYAFPRAVKVGGLASDAQRPAGNALFLNGECHRTGLVGVSLCGQLRVRTVVAQGCRPIGQPMVITRCEKNLILELDHRSPLEVLGDVIESLGPRDRALLRDSLFMGLVMDPSKRDFRQGDFLIRNLVGLDAAKGVLAVGALVRHGQTVQFHLRDRETSSEDLQHVLERYLESSSKPAGALLFSCLGRGRHLYGEPDHDSRMFRSLVGSVPLGGFFCNGEIGPVGGATHVHGYTSCFGLFENATN
jgi:small ligand-binding sensory domain FIST